MHEPSLNSGDSESILVCYATVNCRQLVIRSPSTVRYSYARYVDKLSGYGLPQRS